MRYIAGFLVFTWSALTFAGDWCTYRVYAPDRAAIQSLSDSHLRLLSDRVGRITDVAAPDQRELDSLGLRFVQIGMIPDPMTAYDRVTDGTDYKTEYLRFDEIIAQFETWRQTYPSLIDRVQVGLSHQGRPIWLYRLHNDLSPIPSTSVFFHGLIHAREWISGPVCIYNFHQLLNDALGSAEGWRRITRFQFLVVPVLNPDGYVYTWTSDRLWRKNRRNNGNNFGVDLNRNYPIGWGGVGSSGNSGSETYRGPAPFSEPELSGLRDYLNSVAVKTPFSYTLDYHSYGQYVIHPLGYTETQAPDHAALTAIARTYADAIEAVSGLEYTVGQSSVVQYPAGGTSEDYYYDEFGSLGGTIELRPEGGSGFQLPPSQILPTITEHWAGFRAALNQLSD
jgi:murein tripeptide amidase MpaA